MFLNKQTRSKILWLFADLIMVFLGVYGAFTLDNYRETQQKDQQRKIIINALHTDFLDSHKALAEGFPRFNTIVDSLSLAYENGDMPSLAFMQMDITYRSKAWEALMQNGGFDILGVDLALELEDYYSTVEGLSDKGAKFETLCIQLVLPHADEPPETFYDLKTKKLKKTYSWYFTTLGVIHTRAKDLLTRTEALLKRFEALKTKQ